MAGNKAVFQDAIKKGHNAAWDRKWSVAIAEYGRASREFPEDASAHLSLAHALDASGQFGSALHECQIAAKLLPHDPQPLLLVAALQEKLGNLSEAAGTFLAVADLQIAQKANGKAVDAWQRAAALEPDRADVHERLAEAHEQEAHHSLAAKEFVALARIYKRRGDLAKSGKALQRALELDPSNPTALVMSDGLAEKQVEAAAAEPPAGPVDRAKQESLSRLAETLLEEKPSPSPGLSVRRTATENQPPAESTDSDALIARAVDAQSNGRVPEAIESYRALIDSGESRLEVKFNLGLLYLEAMQYDDAIQFLDQTVGEPDYTLASHFALGQCYRALGKIDAALEHFIQVTKIVDLGSIDRQHADELISVYEKLAESYVAKGDKEQAEAFTKSLEGFMSGKGWEDKVRELHQHLEKLREEGTQVSLAEAIEVPGRTEVLHALTLSQEYLKRGKFEAASAECYHAIELAPYYLPSHVRLAEILAQSGRQQDAREKLQLLAEVAEIRGDIDRAEHFYRNLLELSPDGVTLRSKLIELLQQQGRTSNALGEYLALGRVFTRQGIHDKAAETFAEAIQVALHSGTGGPVLLELRQHLAEARLLQQDHAGALAAYQDLRQQAPGDERVHVRVIELQFRLGQSSAALKDLEQLIAQYRAKGEWRKALAMLEGLVQITPKESSVWAWLAQCYMSAGDMHMAIHALDTLSDLLLSEGRKQAAAATIRQIIALGPPNVEEYTSVLKQIGT